MERIAIIKYVPILLKSILVKYPINPNTNKTPAVIINTKIIDVNLYNINIVEKVKPVKAV